MTKFRVIQDINLREGPAKVYPGIQVIKQDAEVERLDGNGWFYVRAGGDGGRVGWVNSVNLEEAADQGGSPDRELSNVRFNKERRQQYVDSVMREEGGEPNDLFDFFRESDQTWDAGKWLHGYREGDSYFSVAASWPAWRSEGRIQIVEPTRAVSRQEYEERFGLVGMFTYCNFNVSYCYVQAYGGTNLQSPGGPGEPERSANVLNEYLSENWKEVGAEDAARISNAGGFVAASWLNPHGHGHIVFLLDECPETGVLASLRCFHVGSGKPHVTTVGGAFGKRTGVKLFVDPETHRAWFNQRAEDRPPAVADSSPFSIDSNLRTRAYKVTAGSIDGFLRANDSPLAGIGQAAIEAAEKYGINAVYIVAHAIHETGWGRSRIYREKNNLFGWGAIDSSPFGKAGKFPSREVCVDYVMGRISSLYLTPGGRFFARRPCLGNKDYGMNVLYASDPDWGRKIADISRRIESEA